MARYGRQGPVGMGGWLAVFVVTLGALAAVELVSSGSLARDALNGRGPLADPRMHRFLVAAALLSVMRSAGYALIAWRLVAGRSRWAPRLAIAGLWLIGPGSWLATRAPASWTAAVPVGFALVWTLYLLRSERVANTYAPPAGNLATVFD